MRTSCAHGQGAPCHGIDAVTPPRFDKIIKIFYVLVKFLQFLT